MSETTKTKDQEHAAMLKGVVKMIKAMVARHASDIHIHAASPPYMRIYGDLRPFENAPRLSAEQTMQIAQAMMTAQQFEMFQKDHELDFAFMIPKVARFRCNVFYQRGTVSIVMRVIDETCQTLKTLNLPTLLSSVSRAKHGVLCSLLALLVLASPRR